MTPFNHRRSVWNRAALAGIALPLVLSTTAFAASPSPGREGRDLRSSGSGPRFAVDPMFAIGDVVAIGLGTLAATLLDVRMTGRRTAP